MRELRERRRRGVTDQGFRLSVEKAKEGAKETPDAKSDG
jgi:hypothetical protein